ncbi:ABC transporter ATP-binding protein/permease [Dongia deserti]|uniref:ABC transporter ATP-binding protein/permease n=1 Tax=Dongia deserti TaxID=2268030 RepID=UPI0013C52FFB|nr:ABC transporter ATP-binding protein/permease [Dongia deserti]
MEHNLFRYIWRNSWRDQSVILAIVAVSYIFYFISLDLPKQIVNKAIQGEAFAAGNTTAKFLDLSIGPIESIGLPELTLLPGFDLDRISYLVALCFSFLFFVILNGWVKQIVNTEKGRLGERMLRRLRYELYDRVLRFPLSHFRKVKQAEIATMIKDEVEPLGGFIGDAYVTPAFLGGQALTALVFIMLQSVWLGLISVVVLAVQLVVIPILRRRILELGRQRQLTARQLAGRIAENVDGAVEIHANDTSNYERADIVNRLEKIFLIRFELYQRKYFVKYINNMLSQVTPFLFYLIGGYLALTGRFDVGSLVAVIAAYSNLPSPIKELIDWQQQSQDVQIKYEQVIEQFTPDGMMPPELQQPTDQVPAAPAGGFSAQSVAYYDEGGARLLDNAALEVGGRDHLAIVGFNGSGKEVLGLILARLTWPTTGTLRWGNADMATLPEGAIGRHISYVADETYLFPLSILDNVVYGLKHRPIAPAHYEGRALMHYQRRITEARRTANPTLDIYAQWIDFGAAGVDDLAGLKRRIIDLLPAVELDDDVYQFGLRGRIDPDEQPDVAARFLEARAAIHRRLEEPGMSHLVEHFDPNRYNRNMTVAENLLFGTPRGPVFDLAALRDNKVLANVIDAVGLKPALMAMGAKIGETMVELFADLPPGHPFFEQFSFVSADDLPLVQQLLNRVQRSGLENAAPADQQRLVAITFPYIESRHRLGLIDAELEARLLAGRRSFAETLPDEYQDYIEFFDPDRYNAAATVQDNMLFGRLVYGQAQAAQRIHRLLLDVVTEIGLKSEVLAVGLEHGVGTGGRRLTQAQRQKVALVRALVRRPRILILNNALAPLESAAQTRLVKALRQEMKDRCLILIADNAALCSIMDRVAVMRDGRVIEQGPLDRLARPGTALSDLGIGLQMAAS